MLTIKLNKEKEEVKKNMTLKREKRKENVTRKLLEQVSSSRMIAQLIFDDDFNYKLCLLSLFRPKQHR